MNTRIYGRFSSLPQERGDSKRRQIEGAKSYASRHGLNLTGHPYFDEGVSGKAGLNLEREFGRILADSSDGDCILVEYLDRIGRQNPFILGKLLYDTVQKGITVIAWAEGKTITKENINTLETAFSVFTGAAIGFNENQRKITRGKEKNEESYKMAIDNKPSKNIVKYLPTCYGWDDVRKEIIIDQPEKASAIRRVFKLFCDGNGSTMIGRILNKEKVPTIYGEGTKRKNHFWTASSVKRILGNEAYAGRTTIKGNVITCFPPVVSREMWIKKDALLERYKQRKGPKHGQRVNNLFPRIAVCAKCDGTLSINTCDKPGRKPTHSFKCRQSKVGECDCKNMMSITPVEMFFFGELYGGDGQNLLTKRDTELQFKIDGINRQIEQKRAGIANLMDMVESGDMEAKDRVATRRKEIETLQSELSKLKLQVFEDTNSETLADEIDSLLGQGLWGVDGAKEKMQEFYPTIYKTLQDEDFRAKVSVIIPTLIQKIVINLKEKSFHVVRKDGSTTKTIDIHSYVQDLKHGGLPFMPEPQYRGWPKGKPRTGQKNKWSKVNQ